MKGYSSLSRSTPDSLVLVGTLHWQEDSSLTSNTYILRWFIFKGIKVLF